MVLNGSFHPDFGKVAETLIDILPKKTAGGAALCVYHNGEKVVDVWGGSKDRDRTPWQEDTVSVSASTTKGVASTLLHILIDRGLANYDDKISSIWPEFGQNGKENITIRQAMCHEAGLHHIGTVAQEADDLLDWEKSIQYLETSRPTFKPGTTNAYHAMTYGHIIGGIVEKLTGKPFQQVLREELVEPLELDGLFIGVPDEALDRCAKLITMDGEIGKTLKSYQKIPKPIGSLLYYLFRLTGADLRHIKDAMIPEYVEDVNFNDPRLLQAVIPAGNGAFTARSLAKMYAMIANGGEFEGKRFFSPETLTKMSQVQSTRRDKVITFPMRWRLGYHQAFAFGERLPNAFGHYGFGGSGAFCDPSKNLSMGLTLNSGVGTPTGDLRIIRIARDVVRCARRRNTWAKQFPQTSFVKPSDEANIQKETIATKPKNNAIKKPNPPKKSAKKTESAV